MFLSEYYQVILCLNRFRRRDRENNKLLVWFISEIQYFVYTAFLGDEIKRRKKIHVMHLYESCYMVLGLAFIQSPYYMVW